MSQIISLNKSLSWACKTFVQHWQLALMFIAFELGIYFLFGHLIKSSDILPSAEITSGEQLTEWAKQMTLIRSTQFFAKFMQMCMPLLANVIYIPCAFALYQKGMVSFKDALPSLPVALRYLLFLLFYIIIVIAATLCVTATYLLSSTIVSILSANVESYPIKIMMYLSSCLNPVLCLAACYLVARYYLTFCVLFHEKVGLIASLKRAAQLAHDNWITVATLFGLEILFGLPATPLRSPLYFIGILIAVHAYGALRGAEPYAPRAQ